MHRLIGVFVFCLIACFLVNPSQGTAKGLEGISLNGEWYLSYQFGRDGENTDYNHFRLKRGFLLFGAELNSWFSVLATPNIAQESNGDVMVRMQHLLAKFQLPEIAFFTKPNFEVGLVHMPWLDYEESINGYRLQDPMFLDRNGSFNGEDLGITFFSFLGGEIDEEYQARVNSKYPGRYGSLAVGAYNGGGFDAEEANQSKAVEGRLTIRPLPDFVPGLCLSYFGVYGKGNQAAGNEVGPDTTPITIPEPPDWIAHVAFVSYEHEWFVCTFTYYNGTGNQKGTAVNSAGESLDREGYSVFGELRIPDSGLSFMTRYDFFDFDKKNQSLLAGDSQRYMGGVGYKLFKNNMVLLDYEHVDSDMPLGNVKEDRGQVTLRVVF